MKRISADFNNGAVDGTLPLPCAGRVESIPAQADELGNGEEVEVRRRDDLGLHVRAAMAATPIPERLRERNAIVLERIAYGGGATNWYHCRDLADLASIERWLRAGSVVSFYFDDRLRWSDDRAEIEEAARRWLDTTGSCVLAAPAEHGCRLDARDAADYEDVQEMIADLAPGSRVVCGPFPARDNDGVHAVTLQVPDADGVVRPHPH
jgi:hypothetical protein